MQRFGCRRREFDTAENETYLRRCPMCGIEARASSRPIDLLRAQVFLELTHD